MVRFISVGRISEEKGFSEIIALCKLVKEDKKLQQGFQLDIFGDGVLRGALEGAINGLDNVHYHGHQPKQLIMKTWKECDYTMVPSHFLETFGLTALDSLHLGKPIVGYKKGGLAQFGPGLIDITEKGLVACVQELVTNFDRKKYEKLSQECLEFAENYSWEQWLLKFQKESGLQPGSTILIVNDYNVDIGGLENRLGLMIKHLKNADYVVEWYGSSKKKYGFGRFVDLVGTLINFTAFFGLKKKIKQTNPDLVWFHSVHRWLGRFPFFAVDNKRTQWLMFHDFGSFHPYPSNVFSLDQARNSLSFWGFWREAQRGILFFPLIFAKWCSLKILRMIMKRRVEKFFVPSPYMENVCSDHLGKEVLAFPLFVQ